MNTSDDEARRSYLIAMRDRLGLTQAAMARALDMALRAYSDLETGKARCRLIHILAAERVTLCETAARQEADVLSPAVRADVEGVAPMLSGREGSDSPLSVTQTPAALKR